MKEFQKVRVGTSNYLIFERLTSYWTPFTKKEIREILSGDLGLAGHRLIIIDPPHNLDSDFSIRVYNQEGNPTCSGGIGSIISAHFLRGLKLLPTILLRPQRADIDFNGNFYELVLTSRGRFAILLRDQLGAGDAISRLVSGKENNEHPPHISATTAEETLVTLRRVEDKKLKGQLVARYHLTIKPDVEDPFKAIIKTLPRLVEREPALLEGGHLLSHRLNITICPATQSSCIAAKIGSLGASSLLIGCNSIAAQRGLLAP